MTPDEHYTEAARLIADDDIHHPPTAGNIALAQVHATLATRSAPLPITRESIYRAVDDAILHMTGTRDAIGFKDYDHDDIAEAVTQAVTLAIHRAA